MANLSAVTSIFWLPTMSEEIAANFALQRRALCPPEFLDERLDMRLQRRLRKSANLPPPTVIKSFLSPKDIAAVAAFVEDLKAGMNSPSSEEAALGGTAGVLDADDGLATDADDAEEDAPEPGSEAWLAEQMRLSAQLNSVNFELPSGPLEDDVGGDTPRGGQIQQAAWVRCSDHHRKLFLHHEAGCTNATGRTFGQACPDILAKLLEAVHASPLIDGTWRSKETHLVERPPLHLRCLEWHDYTSGGGLIDPGHIDVGSTCTLSVQCSDPGPAERGGRFTTTDAHGLATAHELARGDAIIFCSESVHNVSTLHEGTRNSLVLELWTDPPNLVDRHH